MSTWMAIALAVPLWAIALLLVLAFFRGARQACDADDDAPGAHQNGPGSANAATQPDGSPAPPAPDFRRLD